MKKVLLLALAAAALAVPAAGPASAEDNCTPVGYGANTVSLCRRRNWEYVQLFLACSTDKDLDGQQDGGCKEIPLIEYMG